MASIERLQGRQSQRNVELCNSSAPQKRLPIKISAPVLCRRKAHKESKRTFWIATLILSSIIRRSRSEVATEWLTDVSETWICNTTIYYLHVFAQILNKLDSVQQMILILSLTIGDCLVNSVYHKEWPLSSCWDGKVEETKDDYCQAQLRGRFRQGRN